MMKGAGCSDFDAGAEPAIWPGWFVHRAHGAIDFLSMRSPLKGGTELALKMWWDKLGRSGRSY